MEIKSYISFSKLEAYPLLPKYQHLQQVTMYKDVQEYLQNIAEAAWKKPLRSLIVTISCLQE